MKISEHAVDLNLRPALSDRRTFTFAFLALFIFLAIIYGNSFQGEWLFDDIPHIVHNRNTHLESLSWPDIGRSFYRGSSLAQGEGFSNRPLAALSFALNHYFGGMDVYGYHAVNFTVHLITACFLFIVIYRTLNLPLRKDTTGKSSYAIALLATFFWASSPVQVNAVTYIVQRMTSMAGMFYIMAIYFYLRGRTETSSKGFPYTLSLVCGGLAFATKEIAAMLPASILLYDFLLIQGLSRENPREILRKNFKLIGAFLCCVLLILTITYLFYGNLLDYSRWTFTLKERLLTEPRVILFYITLLLYPASSRLMMDHDIEPSRSLFQPPETLPAIMVLIAMVVFALYVSRRKPLLSFSILFFFLNHLIEGSVLPIDIAFEHRNYVPSLFFFVPIAIFMVGVLDSFAHRKSIQLAMAFGMAVLLAAQAHTVSVRNEILRYPKLLWTDNIAKAPHLSRPHAILGALLYEEGNYREARRETAKALKLANYPNITQPAIYYTNLGLADYHLSRAGDEKALASFRAAIAIQPNFPPAHHGVALVMLRKGLFPQARESCERAVGYDPGNAHYQVTRALILLKSGNPEGAIGTAAKVLQKNKGSSKPLSILAESYRRKGNYGSALFYWKRFLQNEPGNTAAHLALVELYHRQGETTLLKKTVGNLMLLADGKDILALEAFRGAKDAVYVPEKEKFRPILKALFRQLEQESGP